MFLDGNGPSFLFNKVDRPMLGNPSNLVPFRILEVYSGFRSPGMIADSTSKNFSDSTNQISCLHEMRSRKSLNSKKGRNGPWSSLAQDENSETRDNIWGKGNLPLWFFASFLSLYGKTILCPQSLNYII